MKLEHLAALLGAMDMHGHFWRMYYEELSDQDRSRILPVDARDYTTVSGDSKDASLSSNIHFGVDPVDGGMGLNWTLKLHVRSDVADVKATLGADYQRDPYQIQLSELFHASTTEVHELPKLVSDAARTLVNEMRRHIQEDLCLEVWESGRKQTLALRPLDLSRLDV